MAMAKNEATRVESMVGCGLGGLGWVGVLLVMRRMFLDEDGKREESASFYRRNPTDSVPKIPDDCIRR